MPKSLNLALQHPSADPAPVPRRFLRVFIALAVLGFYCGNRAFRAHVPTRLDAPADGAQLGIGSVTWAPCAEWKGVDCGFIVVPKDYFNASAGSATIAVARRNATQLPRKGTVFLNPGGPGGAGTSLATSRGGMVAELVGYDWDLLGFDPRGIGMTRPQVQCYEDAATHRLFKANTVLEQGFTVLSNVTSDATRELLVAQQRQFLALKESQAEACAARMGDELRYMGTATVVRDIDFMSTVLEGEDTKINFWAGSYGSILGAYLVNMLPERVGLVTIDGIADPISWSNEPSQNWAANWVSSTEKTYRMFLEDCANAGPALCPLSRAGEPWPEIEARVDRFLDALAYAPLPVPHAQRPGFVTSGAARAVLYNALSAPRTWPAVAAALAAALAGDGRALHARLTAGPPEGRGYEVDTARLGVTCLDSPPPAGKADFPTAEDLADAGMRALAVSRFGMSSTLSDPDGGCQFWRARGPERFTGPWNATLATPMLIISNTADPITPIASGLRLHAEMRHSSILLIQDGPGHCSLSFPSLCTGRAVRAYFAGTLPKNGTVCAVDGATFPGADEGVRAMSAEDARLMAAMAGLGEHLRSIRGV